MAKYIKTEAGYKTVEELGVATQEAANEAYNLAETAQTTAENAKTIAENAKTIAEQQADWDENDADNVSYVKSRTHYKENVEKTEYAYWSLNVVGFNHTIENKIIASALENDYVNVTVRGQLDADPIADTWSDAVFVSKNGNTIRYKVGAYNIIDVEINTPHITITDVAQMGSSKYVQLLFSYSYTEPTYYSLDDQYISDNLKHGEYAKEAYTTKIESKILFFNRNIRPLIPYYSSTKMKVYSKYTFDSDTGAFSVSNSGVANLGGVSLINHYALLTDGTIINVKARYARVDGDDLVFCSLITAVNNYAHIVGNGTSDTERSNAHTLDWEGNAWYAGDVYVGSTSGTNKDEGSKKLATEEYVDVSLTDKITIPVTAAVGQTIAVKAVDGFGKPTEWEAVDMALIAENGEVISNIEAEELRVSLTSGIEVNGIDEFSRIEIYSFLVEPSGMSGSPVVALENNLGAKIIKNCWARNTTKASMASITTIKKLPYGNTINYETLFADGAKSTVGNDGAWIENASKMIMQWYGVTSVGDGSYIKVVGYRV